MLEEGVFAFVGLVKADDGKKEFFYDLDRAVWFYEEVGVKNIFDSKFLELLEVNKRVKRVRL